MNRRGFLIRLGGGLVATLPPLFAGCVALAREATAPPAAGFSPQAWRTVEAVQTHLLPSEPAAPGAREIHAETFLRGALADPKIVSAERVFLVEGVESLDKLARDTTGKPFIELLHNERESVLRRFEATPEGERWLGEMLGYLMEALVGDPVYGGNAGGAGWKWLAHTPGFPRPPPDKRYFLL